MAGKVIRNVLTPIIASHESVRASVTKILDGDPSPGFDQQVVAEARSAILKALGTHPTPPTSHGLQPEIFEAYCKLAGDPDLPLADWLRHGAPMGATREVTKVGVFPPDARGRKNPQPLRSTFSLSGWGNYKSAEEAPDIVMKLLKEMIRSGWARGFPNLKAATQAVMAGEVKLNKLGLVSKQKPDGTWKHRLVWDLRESGVNDTIDQGERIILPRPCDFTTAIRCLVNGPVGAPGRCAKLLGIDISDAFHQVPNHPAERHLTGVAIQGKIFIFNVLVFGSSSAPTVWGRFAAWLGRSTMAVCAQLPLRMLMFVDDPVYAAVDQLEDVVFAFALALLWAAAAGFPLAWHKADGGDAVTWIGATFTITPKGTSVSIPAQKVATILETLGRVLTRKLLPRREVRSLAGVLAWAATIIPHLKPFLAGFWRALTPDRGARPIPTKHLCSNARWLKAFFQGREGGITKLHRWDLGTHKSTVRICTDASPWGMGGILISKGKVVKYFTEPINAEDCARFGTSLHDPLFISVWEALAILIALHLWGPQAPACSRFEIKSDSLAALRAIEKGTSRSKSLNAVIREIALIEARAGSSCLTTKHIPGVANTVPDALSRVTAPRPAHLPLEVSRAIRCLAPVRDDKFWITSQQPRV